MKVFPVVYLCSIICAIVFVLVQVQGFSIDEPGQGATSSSKRSGKNLLVPSALAYPYSIYAYLHPTYFTPQLTELSPVAHSAPAQPPFPQHLATTGPCQDSKGLTGECVEFKKCYPYFKLPPVANYDTWIIGMFDTCSYYTQHGKQLFGVCCTSTPEKIPLDNNASSEPPNIAEDTEVVDTIEDTSNLNIVTDRDAAKFDNFANWPPPLPTHPPDHTIPPLPTHPPSHGVPGGFPGLVTTSKKPLLTSKSPFGNPIQPITTTKRTTITTKVPSSLGIAACGAKNGPPDSPDQHRIVGGHNADVNEWPWIAALFNSGRQFCGGSLIDDIHILSAAHCVAHMSSWDVARLTVRLGDHNIKTSTETRHIEKKVKRVVRHKGFDSRTLYNDVALLTLDSPVEFSSKVRPVCLPTPGGRDWSGSTGTVIGWGSLRESGPQPSILQEVDIPIWSNQQCKLKYGAAAPGGIVDHMICAGQASKDSCSGDSGGPLMVNNGRWTQVGVVSWGIGCGKGQYPGVYTRVEKFLPWIQKNLKR